MRVGEADFAGTGASAGDAGATEVAGPGGVAITFDIEPVRGLDIRANTSPKMQKAALPAAVRAWVDTLKGLFCQRKLKFFGALGHV